MRRTARRRSSLQRRSGRRIADLEGSDGLSGSSWRYRGTVLHRSGAGVVEGPGIWPGIVRKTGVVDVKMIYFNGMSQLFLRGGWG